MKIFLSNQFKRQRIGMKMAAVLFVMLFAFVSCDKRNIHEVVKEMAEAPVDTTGYVGRIVHTNPFSTVDIDCFADVTFHQTPVGSEPSVELKAPAKVLKNLEVVVEDGDLVISVDRRYKMPEKAVAVVDIYSPFVNSFVLDGGKCLRLGHIALTCPLELVLHGNVGAVTVDSMSVHELSLHLDGSGSFDLKNIETGDLRAKVSGAGSLKVAGKCHSADLFIKGDGVINACELKAEVPVRHSIEGKGKVWLDASAIK